MPEKDESIPAIGEEVDVTIDSVAFGGDGVTRRGKYVIFVPDVIPGERVRVKITMSKRSYGRGLPVRISERSPDRVEPPCEVYGQCGGCQYQHVAYARTQEFKECQLKEVLLRIGGLSLEDVCDRIVPAPESYGYRSAVSLRVRKDEKGWQAGYSGRDNKTFIPIARCHIASTPINDSIAEIGKILERFDDAEDVKAVTMKESGGRILHHPTYRDPNQRLHPRTKRASDRKRHRGPASNDRLYFEYGDIVFTYGPRSFFQINQAMIPALVGLVAAGLGGSPVEQAFLLDLYAGVGLFSISLADSFRQVVAIETGRETVECFRKNARDNGLRNVKVIRGSVEDKLEEGLRKLKEGLPEHEDPAISAIADPPREGMKREVVDILGRAALRRLVYVSCDPSTLARDLKMLTNWYTVERITPLDMFPQTMHLETVAVLERKEQSE